MTHAGNPVQLDRVTPRTVLPNEMFMPGSDITNGFCDAMHAFPLINNRTSVRVVDRTVRCAMPDGHSWPWPLVL